MLTRSGLNAETRFVCSKSVPLKINYLLAKQLAVCVGGYYVCFICGAEFLLSLNFFSGSVDFYLRGQVGPPHCCLNQLT